MKSKELGALLHTYAAVLNGSGASSRIIVLAKFFDDATIESVASTLKRVATDRGTIFWDRAGESAAALKTLQPMLQLIAKSSVVKDVDALIGALERGPRIEQPKAAGRRPRTPRPVSDPGLIDNYVHDLEAALGKQPQFLSVYERLESDPNLSVADVRALAKAFAKASAKSKADALKKIWSRHQSLLSFDAKARATDGRSAA